MLDRMPRPSGKYDEDLSQFLHLVVQPASAVANVEILRLKMPQVAAIGEEPGSLPGESVVEKPVRPVPAPWSLNV
jgi:hypothetical protein